MCDERTGFGRQRGLCAGSQAGGAYTVCREPELKCEHLPRADEAGGLDERLRRFRALYTAVQPHYAPLPHATTQAAAQGAN